MIAFRNLMLIVHLAVLLGAHSCFNGQFNSPHGLVTTRTGQLYVCDRARATTEFKC